MKSLKSLFVVATGLLFAACGGTAENIKEGMAAPQFSLNDQNGAKITLADFKGKNPVILYFYPKAGTAGSTKQACGIRDNFKKFEETGIKVLGISVDDATSLKEFEKEQKLNFSLLSDFDKKVSEEYGVLNKLGVSSRITFIIDKSGNIAHIIRDVDVSTHDQVVFDLAKKLI